MSLATLWPVIGCSMKKEVYHDLVCLLAILLAMLAGAAILTLLIVVLRNGWETTGFFLALRSVYLMIGAAGLLILGLMILANSIRKLSNKGIHTIGCFKMIPFSAVWSSISIGMLLCGGLIDFLLYQT